MCLDKYLNTLVPISATWKINAIARCVLQQVQQHIDATRDETYALRLQIVAAMMKFVSRQLRLMM